MPGALLVAVVSACSESPSEAKSQSGPAVVLQGSSLKLASIEGTQSVTYVLESDATFHNRTPGTVFVRRVCDVGEDPWYEVKRPTGDTTTLRLGFYACDFSPTRPAIPVRSEDSLRTHVVLRATLSKPVSQEQLRSVTGWMQLSFVVTGASTPARSEPVDRLPSAWRTSEPFQVLAP